VKRIWIAGICLLLAGCGSRPMHANDGTPGDSESPAMPASSTNDSSPIYLTPASTPPSSPTATPTGIPLGQLLPTSTITDTLTPTETDTGTPTPGTLKTLGRNLSEFGSNTCVLTDQNTVECWGFNQSGQVGDGTTVDRPTPYPVKGLSGEIIAVAVGGMHACVLIFPGSMQCWGDNRYGQLGDGTTANRSAAVPVKVVSGKISGMALGAWFTCVVTELGAVECWGHNDHGQLGNGTTTDNLSAVKVGGLGSGMVSVSAGTATACAIDAAQTPNCWGWGMSGIIGDGGETDRFHAAGLRGLSTGVNNISVDGNFACAVNIYGMGYCWGDNTYGQLGNGSLDSTLSPVAVAERAEYFYEIKVSANFACGLTAIGHVHCWGFGDHGLLIGAGKPCQESAYCTPQIIGGLGLAAALSVGDMQACIITNAGEVKCWGDNRFGMLGDGTKISQPPPGVFIHL